MKMKARADAVVGFPNDPLVEILSRVPFKSICRFKCVSKAWEDLIVDPLHRSKLPQTIEGFFHEVHVHRRRDENAKHSGDGRSLLHGSVGFYDLSGRSVPLVDAFFSFLRKIADSENIRLLDNCHGLLLLDRGYTSDIPSYIVCNPATQQWVDVPEFEWTPPATYNGTLIHLIRSPAEPRHFDLVHFEGGMFTGVTSVHTYSSKTGAWTHSESDWSLAERQDPREGWRYQRCSLAPERMGTVINGMLYMVCDSADGPVLDGDHLIAVDAQGKTRKFIPVPYQAQNKKFCILSDFVGQSQGLLHYINHEEPEDYTDYDGPTEPSTEDVGVNDVVDYELSIWVLKDDDTEELVLKHSVSFLHLFGQKSCQAGRDYYVVAIHPDRDIVFFIRNDRLISYDMFSKEVHMGFLHMFRVSQSYRH